MSNFLIKLINLYQSTPLHAHSNCRYIPTCSEYARVSIERFGACKGLWLSIKRIIRCNPFGGSGIDLVPSSDRKKK